jgi:hypothetical protein
MRPNTFARPFALKDTPGKAFPFQRPEGLARGDYLTDLMSHAQQTYQNAQGQTNYNNGNPTVAPQSPTTQAGMALTTQRALDGSPVTNAADSSLTNILSGGAQSPGNATLSNIANNGNPNPYLAGMGG